MTPHFEWTVYLVDDDDDDAFFFQTAVNQTHSDCEVNRCDNEKDLINKLEKDKKIITKVIFLDLNLPRVGGIEILRKIRTLAFSSQFPLFILSGSQAPQAITQAYEMGITGYLLKPASHNQWARILGRAIHFAKKLSTK